MRHTKPTETTQLGLKTTTSTGICAGTLIMTLDGDIPVEHLTAGDRLITRDGAVPLRDIKARAEVVCPVRIKASSLGHNRPDHDAFVTLETRVHLRDWRAHVVYGVPSANVAAGRLVDGEFVSVQPAQKMTVFDLGLDDDHIIYADGIEMLAKAA